MTARDGGPLVVLDAADAAERARWIDAWSRWAGREVFSHPDYVLLEADGERTRARAALYEGPAGVVLYPFLQRRIEGEPWWDPAVGASSDLSAPYGYGGAVVVAGEGSRAALADDFWSSFDAWARDEAVVSEFVRFSLFAESLLPYPGETVALQDNVVRTLAPEPDALWMEFEHKVRKNVRKAERSGITIVHDDGERLDEFLEIYTGTMQRREAQSRYYFPRAYFERVRDTLPGQFRYFHALREGRVVSTELVLVSADRLYSFLGGTLEEAFEFRPNDLLKHAIILWGREQRKREFVLGGGYAPDDGIFRYKLAFAPAGRTPFRIGRRVLRPDLYERLTARRYALAERGGAPPREGFFPAYRG